MHGWGRLLDALFARPTLMSEDWLIIVTTDHGGESRDHGPLTEACRRVPLIVSGTGAVRDYHASAANHMDVAATVLRFLGLPAVGPALDGRPLALPVEGRCADGVDDDRDGDLDCARRRLRGRPPLLRRGPAVPGHGPRLGAGPRARARGHPHGHRLAQRLLRRRGRAAR
jgi:arylsulfatase A-like enzyme